MYNKEIHAAFLNAEVQNLAIEDVGFLGFCNFGSSLQRNPTNNDKLPTLEVRGAQSVHHVDSFPVTFQPDDRLPDHDNAFRYYGSRERERGTARRLDDKKATCLCATLRGNISAFWKPSLPSTAHDIPLKPVHTAEKKRKVIVRLPSIHQVQANFLSAGHRNNPVA